MLELRYAYSLLCDLRVTWVPILVQIAPCVPEFWNIFSPLYNSVTNLARVTICLQFPLWLESNMGTDFGSNCSMRSRILKFFFYPFITPLLTLLGLRYAYSFLCDLRVKWVPILVQIAQGVPEFWNIFYPFITPLLSVHGLRYAYSFLCGL